MSRIVAVLATIEMADATPPGVDRMAFLRAMTEDACEMAASLANVSPALATGPGVPPLDDVTWPGTLVIKEATAGAALARIAGEDVAQAAIVAADAPDLPGLLIGKLFRALGRAQVAACPAEGGGLVALASRLPSPDWLDAGFEDSFVRLRGMAPARRDVAIGPVWHRLRTPADLKRLDPGLEGWEATRALLEGRPHPSP